MKPYITILALVAALSLSSTSAILVQPHNYMLDDSPMVGSHHDGGSLSPFYNDQSGASEQGADKDIISIIGEGLARLRFAKMLDNQQADEADQNDGHFSHEMVELMQNEQSAKQEGQTGSQSSLSSSVANMLMNAAQAAVQASASATAGDEQASEVGAPASQNGNDDRRDVAMSSRGSIMELDTSSSSSGLSSSMPSKADLKSGPSQWFNPKETIPVLKISSMATPSKYKKVYFRSEKKLVDGAFHSPTTEKEEKRSLIKPFRSGLQRRSSRGTSSSVAPPSVLQDGVIDFLKKFRDVYVQTRPVSTASGSSASSLASSMVAAAASSPLAAVLSPSSSGSRPNFASALSAATSMVNGAAVVAQASQSGAAPASAATSPNKSPLSTQSYVSFWSKTFPTWVRKMLKQMRRRSLHNSSKRQQQHQHQHSASSAIGQAAQAAASGAVASVVDSVTSGSGSKSSSSSSH